MQYLTIIINQFVTIFFHTLGICYMTNLSNNSQPPKLLDQVVAKLRIKHYSLRTEKS
jgi:hypothetical protein